MTIRIIFYRSHKRENKDGKAPIYGRITSSTQRVEFSTGINLKNNEWDPNKKHIRIQNLHAFLKSIENRFYAEIILNKNIDLQLLKERILNKSDKSYTFNQVFESYILKKSKNSKNTIRIYRIRIRNFNEFLKKTKLSNYINTFNQNSLKSYEDYQRYKGFSQAYIYKNIQFIKIILENARKEGKYQNPKIEYKTETGIKIKERLSSCEAKKIINYCTNKPSKKLAHNLFVIQLLTGIAFVDLMNFKSHTIIDGYIKGRRVKSGSSFSVPLHHLVIKILKEYQFQLPKISNQKYNKNLKHIGNELGINKNMSSQILRRTFGQIMLDKGYSIEAVSYMMGHSDISITQRHYAKSGHNRVMNESEKLRELGVNIWGLRESYQVTKKASIRRPLMMFDSSNNYSK